jgi:hypothetical protein
MSFTRAARGLGFQCSNSDHPHAREQAMSNDKQALRMLNVAINDAENTGKADFLASILAPELAFSRASGEVDDAERFLHKVPTKKSPPRELRPEAIEIDTFGNRAVVKCVITQDGKNYHNIRLFVRIDTNWKLLAWANEQVG